jgi:hypothetical protein
MSELERISHEGATDPTDRLMEAAMLAHLRPGETLSPPVPHTADDIRDKLEPDTRILEQLSMLGIGGAFGG